MECIPYCGVGFFRTWYWESESVTRCIWEAWAICCFHVWKEQCSDNNECSRAKAVLPTMQSHQHIYLHRAPRLPSPSAWGWTKDNHGSHYGQHFVRLRTRTTSRSTVASNKTVKQDASVQLPTSHVLHYATLEETAIQNSLMTAFESSSRFCVSCCNFISVQVTNLLSPVGTLD